MKHSSLTTVVAELTPGGSLTESPNLARLFRSATDLGTLILSTRNVLVIYEIANLFITLIRK